MSCSRSLQGSSQGACPVLLIVAMLLVGASAQQCAPGTGILKLSGMDQSCAHPALQECTSKMQFSVSSACVVQLQPDLPVAADGTFCSPSRGVQQRDLAGGKLVLGRSDIDFMMRPHAASGGILANLKGRIVPNTGGREYPVECSVLFNVTGGSALGIVSSGRDSLMSTSVQPSLAGGGYSGAMVPGQQDGVPGAAGAGVGAPQAPESGKSPQAPGNGAVAVSAGVLVPLLMACLAMLML